MFEATLDSEKLEIILATLHHELEQLYGDQLEAVYLYGSQARGDARPDSDVDVLVVLRNPFDYFQMVERTGEIAAALSLEYDTVISLVFMTKTNFENKASPFLLNVRQEGILV